VDFPISPLVCPDWITGLLPLAILAPGLMVPHARRASVGIGRLPVVTGSHSRANAVAQTAQH